MVKCALSENFLLERNNSATISAAQRVNVSAATDATLLAPCARLSLGCSATAARVLDGETDKCKLGFINDVFDVYTCITVSFKFSRSISPIGNSRRSRRDTPAKSETRRSHANLRRSGLARSTEGGPLFRG